MTPLCVSSATVSMKGCMTIAELDSWVAAQQSVVYQLGTQVICVLKFSTHARSPKLNRTQPYLGHAPQQGSEFAGQLTSQLLSHVISCWRLTECPELLGQTWRGPQALQDDVQETVGPLIGQAWRQADRGGTRDAAARARCCCCWCSFCRRCALVWWLGGIMPEQECAREHVSS